MIPSDHPAPAPPENCPVYMVIEKFKEGALDAIYERFKTYGRQLPDGLYYIDSWLSAGTDADICFQLMATENPDLFKQWTSHWDDLTDFTIYPITEKPT